MQNLLRRGKWILFIFALLLITENIGVSEAQARRRGGLFGGRARRGVGRNAQPRRRQVAAVRRGNGNLNRNFAVNDFDPNLLSQFPVDVTSGRLGFNDQVQLSRLRLAPQLAISRDGRIFQLAGGANLETVQELDVLNTGGRPQIIGGRSQPLSPQLLQQARLINETGDLSTQ